MLDIISSEADRGGSGLAEEARGDEGCASSDVLVGHDRALETIVVTKTRAGFDGAQVAGLRTLVDEVAGGVRPCKFLVFDFAPEHGVNEAAPPPPPGFEALADAVADLISVAPVISVAWNRGLAAGADLEFMLACSMAVGEAGARYSFDLDLVGSQRSYAALAHRVGFVQAERLMDGGAVLDSDAMHEMLLLHSVVPAGAGRSAIAAFVEARRRRHNSACGIYRAQRVAMLHAA